VSRNWQILRTVLLPSMLRRCTGMAVTWRRVDATNSTTGFRPTCQVSPRAPHTPRTASSCARGSETRGIGGGGTGSHAKRSPEPGGAAVWSDEAPTLDSSQGKQLPEKGTVHKRRRRQPGQRRLVKYSAAHVTRPDPTRPDPPRKCERASEGEACPALPLPSIARGCVHGTAKTLLHP
jgi:hypothetical protein